MSLRQIACLLPSLFFLGGVWAEESAIVSGKVLRENDAAVAGLTLNYVGRISGPVVTADDGSFQFTAYEGNVYLYFDSGELRARNIFNVGGRYVFVSSGQNVTNLLIRLHTTSVLVQGTLKNSDGAPIPLVPVAFTHGEDTEYGTTDAEGHYQAHLYPGNWKGGPEGWSLNGAGYLTVTSSNYTFAAGEYTADFVAQRPTITVSGRLFDDSGAAVTNLPIFAATSGLMVPFNYFNASSDGAGNFSLQLAPGEWSIGITGASEILDRGFYPMAYTFTVGGGGLSTNLVLPRQSSRIEGVVRTENGDLLTNLNLYATSSFNGVPLSRWVTTDLNGAFQLKISNGDWILQPNGLELNMRGFEGAAAQTITVSNATNSSIVFLVERPPSVIRGRIRDETGASVSNVVVLGSSMTGGQFRATSDEDGNYSLPVSAGTWTLGFDEGSLRERKYLVPSASNISVVVPAGVESASSDLSVVRAPYSIRVSVVDEAGNPVTTGGFPGLPSTIYAQMSSSGQFLTTSGSLQNGMGEVNVSAGTWYVFVSLPAEFRNIPSRRVVVTNESVNLEIVAERWVYNSTITGQVVDENEKPVTNIVMSVSGDASNLEQPVDAEGRFSFQVASGRWGVSSRDTNYVVTSSSFFVPSGGTTNRVFHARRIDSQIIVTLNHAGGARLDCAGVSASARIGSQVFTVSGERTDDIVSLPVFAGEWRLNFYACDGSVRPIPERTVTVEPASVATLILGLQSAAPTAVLRGTVVDQLGAPVAGAVVAANVRGSQTNTTTGVDGKFSLGVFGTNWDVSFQKPNNSIVASKLVRVLDGQDQNIGTVAVPDATAHVRVILVDTNDVVIPINSYQFISGSQYFSWGRYFSVDSSFQDDLGLNLSPGRWEIGVGSAALNELGYAAVEPFWIDVSMGEVERRVIVKKLPVTVAPPTLSPGPFSQGLPQIRVHYDYSTSVEIEYSNDLKTWKHHSDLWTGSGSEAVVMPEVEMLDQLFFRAILLE